MSALPSEGVSLDQAPPLAVPVSFFALAPVAIAAAGLLLLLRGASPLASGGLPDSMALTHLGTLGLLASVMLGALYQMTPVVAGARVRGVGLARAVAGAWGLGVVALVSAFVTGRGELFAVAGVALFAALIGFLGPVGLALARAPTRSWTVFGMRLALLGLLEVAALGLAFVAIRSGAAEAVVALPGFAVAPWRAGHLGLALVLWVGGLLTAVSWQVLPMFYLAPEPSSRARAGVGLAVASAAVLVPGALLTGAPTSWVLATLAPAAVAVWFVHPALAVRSLRARKRRRKDESLLGWWGSLTCAPLVFGLGLAAVGLSDPRWDVAFVWTAVWGWAALAMHAMLVRIVPFLVWFHRFSALVGIRPVPPMRRLLPQERIRRALLAHAAALAVGWGAIATGWSWAARGTGLLLLVAAFLLGGNLLHVLRATAED